jgi:hypothetical protein
MATRLGLADLERAVTARLCELVMATMLDLTGFERAEARLLELQMWAAATRLNLSNFELVVVARLRSDGLERMVTLAVFERGCGGGETWRTGGGGETERGRSWREAARLRSDDFERAAAELRGLCERAAKLSLGDLEWATTAKGLCELGTQTAAAAKLNLGDLERTGVVRERETEGTARFETGVARHRRKTNRRRLRWVHVAEGGGCRCYVGLDACGMSVAAVRLVCVQARARALVAR